MKSVLDPARFDLGCLAASERLWVWRRRQLSTNGRLLGRVGAGMSQAEAAAMLGIPRTQDYRALEVGVVDIVYNTKGEVPPRLRALLTALGPLRPTASELCRVARRREVMNLPAASVATGWSHVYYLAAERVGDPALVRFWEDRGYRFPPRRENADAA
jgi:hypothetical protein